MFTITLYCRPCDERTEHEIINGQAYCVQCGTNIQLKEKPRANSRPRPEDYREET